jgi:O-antigen ligase
MRRLTCVAARILYWLADAPSRGTFGKRLKMKSKLSHSELQARLSVIEPYLNAIAVFIMATMFLFWDASRAVYVLLSLAAMIFIVRYRPEMPRDHRLYSWPIIGFVGATVLSLLVNGIPEGGPNRIGSRFLLLLFAIPLVSIFYLSFDSKRNPWIKYAAGCVVMGGLALVDMLFLGEDRAGGGHNQAVFGFIALAMTSIVLASYHRFCRIKFGRVVFYGAILMGVCAMVLSGTRSSWIAGFVVLALTMFYYFERYSLSRRLLVTLALAGGIAITASSIPIVQKRIDSMIDQVTPYLKGEEQTEFTSLRYRVELWKLAWHVGLDNKLFGYGPGITKRVIKDYVKQRPHLKGVETMNHFHNQFLLTFAMTGLVGLASFLALLICHFRIFTKYLGKQYSPEVRCLAFAGFLLLVAYLLKCVPGVPFYGKQYLMMYGFASATIWGCLLGALRQSQEGGSSEPASETKAL